MHAPTYIPGIQGQAPRPLSTLRQPGSKGTKFEGLTLCATRRSHIALRSSAKTASWSGVMSSVSDESRLAPAGLDAADRQRMRMKHTESDQSVSRSRVQTGAFCACSGPLGWSPNPRALTRQRGLQCHLVHNAHKSPQTFAPYTIFSL